MWFIFSVPGGVILLIIVILIALGYAFVTNILNIVFALICILLAIDGIASCFLNNYKSKHANRCMILRLVNFIEIAFILHIFRDAGYIDVNGAWIFIALLLYLLLSYTYSQIGKMAELGNKGKQAIIISIILIFITAVIPCAVYLKNDIKSAKEEVAEIKTYIVVADKVEVYNAKEETVVVNNFKDGSSKNVKVKVAGEYIVAHCYKDDILEYKNCTSYGYALIKTASGVTGFVKTSEIEPYQYQTRYDIQY